MGSAYKIKHTTRSKVSIIVLLLICAQIVLAVFFYHQINRHLNHQVQQVLFNENDEAKSNLQSRIENKLELMEISAGIASINKASAENQWDEWWELIQKYNDESGRRIGIADAEGTLFFGDKETIDIGEKQTYQETLQGKSIISPLRKKAFNGQDSIILATPITRQDGTVSGVLEMEYTTLELGNYLNHTDLNGSGVNLVINQQGELIATVKGMETYETIYDMLKERKMDSCCSIDQMKTDVLQGNKGYLLYSLGKDQRMLCYQPAEIEDWTVVSIASVKKYTDELIYTKRLTSFFIIISMLLTGGGFLILFRMFWKKNKALALVSVDGLTGVFSRAEGERLVGQYLRNPMANCYGCLFLDLDNFKQLNDTTGHGEGDRILKLTGEVIRSSIRGQDIVYRFGGDEFCIWLFGNGGKSEIENVANRILQNSYAADDHLRFSIGATCVTKEETEYTSILKRADEALYDAKRMGKGKIAFR